MAFNDDDQVSNESANPSLGEMLENLSRRRVLTGGLGAAGLVFLGCDGELDSLDDLGIETSGQPLIGFTGVPISTEDTVVVPEGYVAEVLYAWGDPISDGPAFAPDASNSAADQEKQAGMHHDGIHFFPLDSSSRKQRTRRGLLVMNHEYTDDGLLHVGGMVPWTGRQGPQVAGGPRRVGDRGRAPTTASGRSCAPRPTPAGSPPTRPMLIAGPGRRRSADAHRRRSHRPQGAGHA